MRGFVIYYRCMFTLYAVLFGLIIGSFLNVVILRFGERPLTGRSGCMTCGKSLAWHDLIPVISWVRLGGKCRMCGTSISLQYPLVELVTGLLFGVIAGANLPIPLMLLGFGIVGLFVAIYVYDLYYMLIPDLWAYLAALLAFLSSLYMWWQWGALLHDLPNVLLAGCVTALPLFFLWAVSGGRWMGFGDVKLALSFGWLLGIRDGLYAVFGGFVIGAVISLLLVMLSSTRVQDFLSRFTPTSASRKSRWRFTMASEIPFGPFLIISCLLVWISQLYSLPLPLAWWYVGI